MTLRSICSITTEARSGSKHVPVILMQFVNFNLFTLLTELMHSRTPLISESMRFLVKTSSICPKSRVSQLLPTMAELLSLGMTTAEFSSNATANKALNGAARKLAACASIPVGKSVRYLPPCLHHQRRKSAFVWHREGLLPSCLFWILDLGFSIFQSGSTGWLRTY